MEVSVGGSWKEKSLETSYTLNPELSNYLHDEVEEFFTSGLAYPWQSGY